MKFLETHFEDYVKSVELHNLHPLLKKNFPDKIENMQNMILYGPAGVGKYSQALYGIQKYSNSDLKYERKLNIEHSRGLYNIKISDIHFEIDMSLLGCNAKILWNSIYMNILDIVSTRPERTAIVLCKNFHKIHSELLDVFYSYMQSLSHKNVHLVYILMTEHVGFIPFNIINRSIIVSLRRPTRSAYEKCIGHNMKKIKLSEITNIKDHFVNITQLMNSHASTSNKIINRINNYCEINFLEFREILYELFIYNIDIGQCIWYILYEFIKGNKLTEDNIGKIFIKIYPFLKYFNNNYRPIYHLENFMIYLCKIVHEL